MTLMKVTKRNSSLDGKIVIVPDYEHHQIFIGIAGRGLFDAIERHDVDILLTPPL